MSNMLLLGAGGPATAAAATIAYVSNNSDDSVLTTYTFASQAIGTATSGRRVIVSICGYNAASGARTASVTVGGNSCTQLDFLEKSDGTDRWHNGLYLVALASGTTANIVVTWSGAQSACGIAVWEANNLSSDTPTATYDNHASSQSINVSAGGFFVASAFGVFNNRYTWAPSGSEDHDNLSIDSRHFSGASEAYSTAQTGLTVSATPGTAYAALDTLVIAAMR